MLIPYRYQANLNWQPIGNQKAKNPTATKKRKHKKIQSPLSDWIS